MILRTLMKMEVPFWSIGWFPFNPISWGGTEHRWWRWGWYHDDGKYHLVSACHVRGTVKSFTYVNSFIPLISSVVGTITTQKWRYWGSETLTQLYSWEALLRNAWEILYFHNNECGGLVCSNVASLVKCSPNPTQPSNDTELKSDDFWLGVESCLWHSEAI